MVGVLWSHKDWEVAGAITCRHGIEICCLRLKKKKTVRMRHREMEKKKHDSVRLFSVCFFLHMNNQVCGEQPCLEK